LLNVAFADSPAWTLLCPYDVDALAPAVVAEARRSHPYLNRDGRSGRCDEFVVAHPSPSRMDDPLPPPPPAGSRPIVFGPDPGTLGAVRTAVRRYAERAGVGADATESLVLAVSEVATNSIRHGGGRGTIQLWRDDRALVCEVRDSGRIGGPPLLGRVAPEPGRVGGWGLWLANQLCDLVQVRSGTDGTAVRLWIGFD
jgi:anti-sigma regulatory factor (Ser/Thr protein kinase)